MDFTRRRLIRRINSYLIFAALISAGVFALTLADSGREAFIPHTEEPVTAAGPDEAKPLEHYYLIEEKNLFGPAPAPEHERPPAAERPREPEMPSLKLKGTVLFASGGGYAIIEDTRARAEETVKPGEEISGMELLSVEWNRAVLRGEPGELTLTIEDEAAPAASPQTAGRRAAASPAARPGTAFTVPQSRVNEAIADAENIFREIRVTPADNGFQVSGIRPGSLADEFGLKDGDVITSVNRTPLTGPENMMRVYNDVLQRGSASVEVMRDGQRVNLRYRIER